LALADIPSTRAGRQGVTAEETQVAGPGTRDKKTFGLFAVVSFQNEQCTAASDSTTKGTCFTSTECGDKSGTADGNCAAGFGVCCTFTLNACGGTVSQNCSYFTNAGYPTTVNTASTTCTYSITTGTDICQLRLDLDSFITATNDAAAGTCGTAGDTVTITSPSGREPPVVCGTLTGEHIYVETGTLSPTTVAIATGTGTTVNRSWKVKVSMIECSSTTKAPQDCTHYFTGASGTFKSFNFDGGHMLQTQNQAFCFRQEKGYCAIDLSPDEATTAPDSFEIFDSANAPATTEYQQAECLNIRFNVVPSTSGFYCGDEFGSVRAMADSGSIRFSVVPFRVVLTSRTASVESSDGFLMRYNQVPC